MLQTLGILGAASVGTATTASGGESEQAAAPADSGIGTAWWAELVSADLAKAAEFYSSVVGWTAKTVAMSDNSRAPQQGEPAYLFFMTAGNEVAGGLLAATDSPGKTKPTWIIYFQVADLDVAVAKAMANGGTLLVHPFEVPGSARMAVIADPDGTPVGLASPL
jgi:predicted enzyme related to lactoylglutathione lyase